MDPSSPGAATGPRRAMMTRMSPMSAMYEMVRSAWSIMISCNTQNTHIKMKDIQLHLCDWLNQEQTEMVVSDVIFILYVDFVFLLFIEENLYWTSVMRPISTLKSKLECLLISVS